MPSFATCCCCMSRVCASATPFTDSTWRSAANGHGGWRYDPSDNVVFSDQRRLHGVACVWVRVRHVRREPALGVRASRIVAHTVQTPVIYPWLFAGNSSRSGTDPGQCSALSTCAAVRRVLAELSQRSRRVVMLSVRWRFWNRSFLREDSARSRRGGISFLAESYLMQLNVMRVRLTPGTRYTYM